MIAKDVAELHGENNLTKQTALNEKGDVVNGRGDNPNMHDILTGTQPDGTAFGPEADKTCGNWTKSGAEGSAISAIPTAPGYARSAAEIVEFVASDPRLQPAGIDQHRRRRPALLLRDELASAFTRRRRARPYWRDAEAAEAARIAAPARQVQGGETHRQAARRAPCGFA